MKQHSKKQKYPIVWKKKDVLVKVYCSIPNIATGISLKTANSIVLVDPGDGILRDLNRDLPAAQILQITDIFVSHGHHDHVGGVWSLLTYLRVMHKTSPMTIHYPDGCVEIETLISAFNKVYAKGIPYKLFLHKLSSSNRFTRSRMDIKPFTVSHREIMPDGRTSRLVPALGYKFTYFGVTVCYGGDTAYCASLAHHAKGADLAILEAGNDDDSGDHAMHMTQTEAEKIGASAKEYFLVHVPEKE